VSDAEWWGERGVTVHCGFAYARIRWVRVKEVGWIAKGWMFVWCEEIQVKTRGGESSQVESIARKSFKEEARDRSHQHSAG
jgi:hypothetical protein